MTATCSVALIGDTRLSREVLSTSLMTAGLEVLYAAMDADDYLAALRERGADIIVVLAVDDVNEQLANLSVNLNPGQKVALIGPFLTGGNSALRLAADGRLTWIDSYSSVDEFAAKLCHLSTLAPTLSPTLLAMGLARLRSGCSPQLATAHLPRFTLREREVAKLISDGLLNKQIARRLGLRLGTVKGHVHRIMNKLDVGSRRSIKHRLLCPVGTNH